MKRKIERTPLVYHLKVMNKTTDRLFGYLGNITTQGVLLFCPKTVALDTVFALEMTLPVPVNGVEQIPFNATSVWCQRDEKLGMYAAGFRIEELDITRHKLIADTISRLRGNER
jgi:hypothetical protein